MIIISTIRIALVATDWSKKASQQRTKDPDQGFHLFLECCNNGAWRKRRSFPGSPLSCRLGNEKFRRLAPALFRFLAVQIYVSQAKDNERLIIILGVVQVGVKRSLRDRGQMAVITSLNRSWWILDRPNERH